MRRSYFKYSLFPLWVLLCLIGCGPDRATPIAPGFELTDLEGGTASLARHPGAVILLDFWSVSCYACKVAIPELVELQNKYRDRGLIVIGVTVDHPSQVSDMDLKEYAKIFKINYQIARADYGMIRDYFAGRAGIALPTLFIINRQGQIVKRFEGFYPGAVEKALRPLIP